MKHAGIARRAAAKLILVPLLAVFAAGLLGALLGWPAWLASLAVAVAALWLLFAVFTVYFFRDPEAKTPGAPGVVVSPGHGKVDAVEMLKESPCFAGPVSPHLDFFVGDRHSRAERAGQREDCGFAACAGAVSQRAQGGFRGAERKRAHRICLERKPRREDRGAADRGGAGAADRAVCQEWATNCSAGNASA